VKNNASLRNLIYFQFSPLRSFFCMWGVLLKRFIIYFLVVVMVVSGITGVFYYQEYEHDLEVSALKSEIEDLHGDLSTLELKYRDNLRGIVTEIYSDEAHSTGGYSTDAGDDVTAMYEAVLNAAMDFDSFLLEVRNYFDARHEYLTDIPSIWPVEYNDQLRITSPFGWRLSPITGMMSYHGGVDIASEWSAKVLASADGVVTDYYPAPNGYYRGHEEFGGYIEITHAGGFVTRYAHLSSGRVRIGMEVSRGDWIGNMGNTGKSRGQHLHYEVILNGVPVNPLDYLLF
jgi:murein DD-endopeptidase MepM/ murein hydrolase activator NlpD